MNQTPLGVGPDGLYFWEDAATAPAPDVRSPYDQMSEDDRYRLLYFAELWDRYHDYRYGPSMSAEELAELEAFRARNPTWRPTF